MTNPWTPEFIDRVTDLFTRNPRLSYGLAAETPGVSRNALLCGCKRRGLDVLVGKSSKPSATLPYVRGPNRIPRQPRPRRPTPDLAAIARDALADGVKITKVPDGFARGSFQTRWPSLVGSML